MTLKVTVTEDVSTVSVSGDTTSINLTGEQTEISVVKPAATVTYNPTAPITATNVQDAIPQAHKLMFSQAHNDDLTLQHGNSFKITSGNQYAEFSSYGGQGGWSAEINSSEQITLRNGGVPAALFESGSMTLYDTLYAGWSGGSNDSFIETTSSTSSRKHISLKSGTSRKGYMGISSVSMYIGSGETALGFIDYLGTKVIRPSASVNQPSDASISLGANNARFKELYLSDNLYADGVEFVNGAITFTTSAFNVKSQYSVTTISSDNHGVSLYFNGSEKFETTTNGVQVSGDITTQASGSNNGDITVSGTINANGVINVDDIQSDNIVNIDGDNGVILKHDNTARISTSNSGVTIDGYTVLQGNAITLGTHEVYEKIYAPKLESLNSDVIIQSKMDDGQVEIKGTVESGSTFTNFIANGHSAIIKSSSNAYGRVTCTGSVVQVSGFFQPLNGIQFDPLGTTLLDDYEEGTWTPTLVGESGGSYTIGSSVSSYTKIGNTVHIQCDLEDIDTTGTGITNRLHLAGLPYLPNGIYTASVANDNISTSSTVFGVTLTSGSKIEFRISSANFGVVHANVNSTTTGDMTVCCTYKTDS